MNTKTAALFIVVFILLSGIWIVSQKKTTVPRENTPSSNSTTTPEALNSRYIPYSKQAFDNAKDKKRVYFFHATWCPTCKAINEEFSKNGDKIPDDVVVFKTDYDSQTTLKRMYAIPSQHFFVLVDQNGTALKKWSGGGLAELLQNTQNIPYN